MNGKGNRLYLYNKVWYYTTIIMIIYYVGMYVCMYGSIIYELIVISHFMFE